MPLPPSALTLEPTENPFFGENVFKVCAICCRQLKEDQSSSIGTVLDVKHQKTAYDVLASISKFRYTETGPKQLCAACYKNTKMAYKFQKLCNKAQIHIENLTKQKKLQINSPNNASQLVLSQKPKTCVEKVEKTNLETQETINFNDNKLNFEDYELFPPEIIVSNEEEVIEQIENENIDCFKNEIEIEDMIIEIPAIKTETERNQTRIPNSEAEVTNNFSNNSEIVNLFLSSKQNSSALNNRWGSKQDENRKACSICGERYLPNYLKRHLRLHNAFRRHECHVCGAIRQPVKALRKQEELLQKIKNCRDCRGN